MDAKDNERNERRGEPLLIVMATGIVGVTALISALALVGGWWFLAATMATLLACAGGVVAMILRLLAQTGDPAPAPAIAHSPVAVRRADSARTRPAPGTAAYGAA